ncbi:hypothetical protein PMI29_01308 [Pseudomonas sp. GM49]|uniref:hypothetical protein n=1 Tax=Pseudomonas sp. GM49 TaxID=1144331 RepID=UPI000270799B|nr:hypothetical protein [Pseudomonas sp. GM49]EJM71638.1 hypothetical protein PMI29_01308 [Pseudomonas sp. GM49]
MNKDSVVAIDPASKRCVLIGAGDTEYLKELFDMGLILVPVERASAVKALHEQHQDVFKLNSERSTHSYPAISPPDFKTRIEAAFVSVAFQGQIGLSTRLALMHPSTDLDSDSCAKYATIVLSRLASACLESLPAERSALIQRELAEYLISDFECP